MNVNTIANFSNQSFAITKMISTASIKIFMNYSQTIAILNSLNLSWEYEILEVFNIHKVASGGFQEIVSIECFMKGKEKYFFLNSISQKI